MRRDLRTVLAAAGPALLLAAPADALAQGNGGFLDTFLQSYQTAATSWDTALTGYATGTFWLLAAIELAMAGTSWALQSGDFQSFSAAVIRRIMGISGFYLLLIGATSASPFGAPWPQLIINSFMQAGTSAAGGQVAAIGSAGQLGSPGALFNAGVQIATTMLSDMNSVVHGLSQTVMYGFMVGTVGLVIVGCFAFVTAILMATIIESYIVIHAGILILGFGGSRFTQDFVSKYFTYAMSVGIKLFMLYLVVGTAQTTSSQWLSMLGTANTAPLFFQAVLSLFAGSGVFAYLCLKIPTVAGTLLSGSPQLSAGEMLGTGAAVLGGVVGGAAAAAAGAVGAARGGAALGSALSNAVRGGSGAASAAGDLGAGARAGASLLPPPAGAGSNSGDRSAPRPSPPPASPAGQAQESESAAPAGGREVGGDGDGDAPPGAGNQKPAADNKKKRSIPNEGGMAGGVSIRFEHPQD